MNLSENENIKYKNIIYNDKSQVNFQLGKYTKRVVFENCIFDNVEVSLYTDSILNSIHLKDCVFTGDDHSVIDIISTYNQPELCVYRTNCDGDRMGFVEYQQYRTWKVEIINEQ